MRRKYAELQRQLWEITRLVAALIERMPEYGERDDKGVSIPIASDGQSSPCTDEEKEGDNVSLPRPVEDTAGAIVPPADNRAVKSRTTAVPEEEVP